MMINKILDFSNIGYCQCRQDGEIIKINNMAYQILGINDKIPDLQNVPGNNIFAFFNEYRRIFDRVNSQGAVKDIELSLKTHDGNIVEILHYFLIDEEYKNMVNLIIRDMTEIKKIQREYRNSEKQLMSIINLIPDIVYRLDADGKITFISQRIMNYGYSPNELLGKFIIDFVHPDDKDKAVFKLNERRSGERATKFFEIRIITKNKGTVSFEIENYEILNSQYFSISAEGIYISDSNNDRHFVGTQGIARDITRKRPSDSALKLYDEKYYALIDSLYEGYYELNMEGAFKYTNTALCKMYGYSRDVMLGKKYNDCIDPDYEEFLEESYGEVLNAVSLTKIADWVAITSVGKKLQVQGSISLLRDADGNPCGYIGIVRDMTEQKKMEEELFRARKLEAIGIFSGGIAHDYNNALTTIIGNIALAKLEFGKTDEKLMEFLSDAEVASLRVKELTQQLSSLSKGGRPVKQIKFIGDVINDVVKTVMKNFNGEYNVVIPDDLWYVEIDEYQFSHVLEYIITNSLEAISENGMISIVSENVHVDKEKSHHEIILIAGDYLKITISDNGKGINKEDINKIFDPYYSTKEFRSGMGLAISYAILKRHDGYIDVSSTPGAGSEFYIYLPRAQ